MMRWFCQFGPGLSHIGDLLEHIFCYLLYQVMLGHVWTTCLQSCILDMCLVMCSDKCSNTHLTCSGLFLTLGRVIGPTFSCLFLLFLNKCLSTRWIPLAQSLIMCYDHMFPCMLDSVFVGRFDPTAPLPAASF